MKLTIIFALQVMGMPTGSYDEESEVFEASAEAEATATETGYYVDHNDYEGKYSADTLWTTLYDEFY